jgi:hypothetical protein
MAWNIRRWSAPRASLCRWTIAANRMSALRGAQVQSSSDQRAAYHGRGRSQT